MDDDNPSEDEKGLTDEEPAPRTPPPSPPRNHYQPYHHHGKGIFLMRIPRMSVPPVYHLDLPFMFPNPLRIVESYKALPHVPRMDNLDNDPISRLMTQGNRLSDTV
ncbi:unnamed protein product [Lactuca saligna]|uniref:Uncharacterized protein n=1 Tax=Lactuca saligna TaxID=75948 RepID=A0AA35VHM8_LACSI|nr:unnamed protein product [Lactuca saligna]